MNSEINRLQTFNTWPTDAPVSPERMAKAGFYYLNQNLTVKCYCCNLEISEWNYGDQVMSRHRQLSPNCAFVINPLFDNVPQLSNATSSSSSRLIPRYNQESDRLRSFENWPVPHIVSPQSLAKAGFYYLNQGDKTKCAFCNGVVVMWEEGDDPDEEHQRHFPNCRFVQIVINPRLEDTNRDNGEPNISATSPSYLNMNIVNQGNLQELGVNRHRGPKRSKYSTLESRMHTFATWPDDLIQTPDVLSQAGFYYEGHGDQVRCFHCDGGLKHWDPQDDPWTEHARWFPKCAYILLVRGQEFVTACAIETDTSSSMEVEPQKSAGPSQRREVTDQDIQVQMLTPEVMAALNVGLHFSRVKQAIKEKLERTGVGFATADEVIEAALNLQRDEDDSVNPQISQEVSNILVNAVRHSLNGNATATATTRSTESSATVPSVEMTPVECRPSLTLENSLSLEEENRLLKEARLCKICMDNEIGIVFLPCGHLTTCINCAPNLQDCPVCRCSIKATVRTFLS